LTRLTLFLLMTCFCFLAWTSRTRLPHAVLHRRLDRAPQDRILGKWSKWTDCWNMHFDTVPRRVLQPSTMSTSKFSVNDLSMEDCKHWTMKLFLQYYKNPQLQYRGASSRSSQIVDQRARSSPEILCGA
jgi:hypothetical protein